MASVVLDPLKRLRRFVTFAAVGVLGTASHYLVLVLAVELVAVDPVLASFLGAVTGAVINYFLNHAITFKSTVAHRQGLPKFLMVAASGLALNTGSMALLFDVAGLHYVLSQVLATGAVLVWNYLGSALWAFRAPVTATPSQKEESL
jgi:putative flippase GtrA